MLLSWMFTSSYTIIYFFVKKFIFLNVYISVNAMFGCLYMFFGWKRDHQLSKYGTVPTDDRWQSDFSLQKLGLFFQSQYLLTLFLGEAVAMK